VTFLGNRPVLKHPLGFPRGDLEKGGKPLMGAPLRGAQEELVSALGIRGTTWERVFHNNGEEPPLGGKQFGDKKGGNLRDNRRKTIWSGETLQTKDS